MLSDYIGTGSHSIPYALTLDEMTVFLERHAGDVALQNYLDTKNPPYGIIVQEGPTPSEFLVWIDPATSGTPYEDLHIIDVTFMPIAASVKQAPYESPSPTLTETLTNFVQGFVSAVQPTVNLGLIAIIAVAAFLVVREWKR